MFSCRIIALLASLVVVAACSKDKSGSQQLSELSKKLGVPLDSNGSAGSAKTGDSCSLLDSSEVEAAIGPLANSPYHGSSRPNADAPDCRYDTKDHRRMIVNVDWSGGPAAMGVIRMGRGVTDQISKKGEMKTGTTVLASGDTLVGEWDEIAEGAMQCCDLHALRGDQHVELDWTGTRLSTEGAAKLLDSAVKRLDSPLKIDGAAGVPAALQLYSQEAKDSTLNMCALLTQADVETALGKKLSAPPQPGTGMSGVRECDYHVVTQPGFPVEEYDLTLMSWRDGAEAFAEDQYVVAMASHALHRQITGDTTATPTDTLDHPPGPWDEAGFMASPGYEAIKGRWLVRVSAMGHREAALGLLARAVTAIGAR
ncbi:MAG: hypothetical protein ACHQRL_03125 [Gemmatimonadales bacterium]